MYIPSLNLCRTWRLSPHHSVLTAELFAISSALRHLQSLAPGRVVIYSDSRSSLMLVGSRTPRTHNLLVHDIQTLLLSLCTRGWVIALQWVPSHVGIRGNEIVDQATRNAVPASEEPLQLELCEATLGIRKAMLNNWDTALTTKLQTTALGLVRTDASPSPWTRSSCRRLDVAILRLRIGHCGLQAHKHRLRLVDSPYCSWCQTQEETVEHFLLLCPRFHSLRTTLRSRLSNLGVRQLTLAILLDGAGFGPPLRSLILHETAHFLTNSGQLSRL